ncbi:MAG TPA: sigma-70 family RNA polymerase sigma factor [Thermoanaerobaculia bacterium]|nr:sigma-70 family RNA polymerase sigma factor [Thermoanaerobaculia bacterium]
MAASNVLTPGLPTAPDFDLADRHRYGDESAFTELYDRFSPMVYNLCLRLSGDPTRAQDLSQEVFLRVFKGLPKYRGGSSLKTWIYRIALNHCRGRLGRRTLPTEEFSAEHWDRGPADPTRGPEESLLARDRGRRIDAALLALPVRFREAVVLRDVDGLSYQEIATVLGVRAGTVRSRIARGRDRLRTLLEAEE